MPSTLPESAPSTRVEPTTPTTRPQGMPMAAITPASQNTMERICRRLAPMEESRPNWRVRSATEMAKALKMSETDAMTTTAQMTPAITKSVSQMARSEVMRE